MLNEYDAVIREQLEEGVVERAPAEVTGREFCLLHRVVVHKNAETTKLRVVCACSRETPTAEGTPARWTSATKQAMECHCS